MAYSDNDLIYIASDAKKKIGINVTPKEFRTKYPKIRPYPCLTTLHNRFGNIKNLLQRVLDWERDNLKMGIMTIGNYKSECGKAELQITSYGKEFRLIINSGGVITIFKIPRREI